MQKKSVLICLIILCAYISANAQVKIGDNPTNINENSLLELESTNKGFVFPGVSLDDISSPSPMTGSVLPGTIVYNTNLLTTGGLGAGLYIWNGSQWAYLKQSTDAGSSDNWSTTGNSGSISNTKFLGTSDNNGLSIRTSNLEALHIDSLQNVSVGTISSDNRFETLGKFRLHSGDFSVMYSPDILPGFFPGIEFAGTQHNSADTAYMFSGIVNLPPVFEANEPLAAITGYLNPSSQINTLLNITKTNINANTNNGIKGSGINLDMENGVNLYSQKNDKNSNTNSNLNLNDNGVSLSYYTNASGNQENTGLNLNSTSLYFNAYQGAWNRYSNMNLSTTDYSINVSSQDTSNSMGINSSGFYFNRNHYPLGFTGMSLLDTALTQNINSVISNKSTSIYIQPASYGISMNDNSRNVFNNVNINESGSYININDLNRQLFSTQNSNAGSYSLMLNNNMSNWKTQFDLFSNGLNFNTADDAQHINTSINSTPGTISILSNGSAGDGTAFYISPQYYNLHAFENSTQKNADIIANASGLSYHLNDPSANKSAVLEFNNNFNLQTNNLTANSNASLSVNSNNVTISTNSVAPYTNTSLNMQAQSLYLGVNSSAGSSALSFTDRQAEFAGSNFRLGIQTSNPQATVDANGTFKLGERGTVSKTLTGFTGEIGGNTVPAASINTGSGTVTVGFSDIIISVPSQNTPSSTQAAINVSPESDLADGISIAWAKMISPSEIKVRFINSNTLDQPLNGHLFITILEF